MVTGERALLREFFLQRKTSLWLPQNEPEVKSLDEFGDPDADGSADPHPHQ